MPTAVGLSLLAIIAPAAFAPLAYLAVAVWGAAFGGILNLVQVWVSRVLPDRMEAGSGLIVAGFQLAIILGSAIGGRGVDSIGLAPTYALGAVAAVLGGALISADARAARRHSDGVHHRGCAHHRSASLCTPPDGTPMHCTVPVGGL